MKRQLSLPMSQKPAKRQYKGFRLGSEYVQLIVTLRDTTGWQENTVLEVLLDSVTELLIMDPHGLPRCIGDLQARIKSARINHDIQKAAALAATKSEADHAKNMSYSPSVKKAEFWKLLQQRT